jgi:hypothetical protein
VVIVDIAGTVNITSSPVFVFEPNNGTRADGFTFDGTYVAVGNETTFFPAIPNVYLAVVFFAIAYGSVAAITGETANKQNAAISNNAKVIFFIHYTSLYRNITLMRDICFLVVLPDRVIIGITMAFHVINRLNCRIIVLSLSYCCYLNQ